MATQNAPRPRRRAIPTVSQIARALAHMPAARVLRWLDKAETATGGPSTYSAELRRYLARRAAREGGPQA